MDSEMLATLEPEQRLLHQILDVWVKPEIERRKSTGTLPPGFVLSSAQIIMNVGQPNQVRLNEQVSAVLQVVASKDVKAGDPVYWDEIAQVKYCMLTESDPNAGHFTMFRNGQGWLIFFDCRYNAQKVEEVLTAADEFLSAATHARDLLHGRAFMENLFAAAELTAKARLMLLPDEQILKAKTHGAIHAKINMQARLGNVDQAFVDILNDLNAERGTARYVQGVVNVDSAQMTAMEETIRSNLVALRETIPKRHSSQSDALG